MKLISMSDYVLEQNKKLNNATEAYEQYCKIVDYANFLKQPLKLEMFFPCDEDGNVLEYPIDIYYRPDFDCQKFPQECYQHDLEAFENAKEKVLFEGFEIEYTKEDTPCFFLYNEKIGCNVFLDKSFGVRHENIEDLIGLDIECAVTF